MISDDQFYKMAEDTAHTRALMETFIGTTFPAHVKSDDANAVIAASASASAAKIAASANGKINKFLWAGGGVMFLFGAIATAHEIGLFH